MGNQTITGDAEINGDVVLAPAAVNVELDVDFKRATVQSCALMCTSAATVKTNSSSAPQDTINLSAGQPVILASNAAVLAQFSGDVTKFFLSCVAGGTFSIRTLLNV